MEIIVQLLVEPNFIQEIVKICDDLKLLSQIEVFVILGYHLISIRNNRNQQVEHCIRKHNGVDDEEYPVVPLEEIGVELTDGSLEDEQELLYRIVSRPVLIDDVLSVHLMDDQRHESELDDEVESDDRKRYHVDPDLVDHTDQVSCRVEQTHE